MKRVRREKPIEKQADASVEPTVPDTSKEKDQETKPKTEQLFAAAAVPAVPDTHT